MEPVTQPLKFEIQLLTPYSLLFTLYSSLLTLHSLRFTPTMRQLYIVSTGRCGTKRMKEILETVLPADRFAVEHQMPPSRKANVLGNLMYYFGGGENLRERIIGGILDTFAGGRDFVCTDPLISMVLPDRLVQDPDVMILHVVREKTSFARSFFQLSRSRARSFIAHNFIPFWQLSVWPLENLFRRHILKKYERVWELKNTWLQERYTQNPNYQRVDMRELFSEHFMEGIIHSHFGLDVVIPPDLLAVRSNQSSI